jgi:hypothetical protein
MQTHLASTGLVHCRIRPVLLNSLKHRVVVSIMSEDTTKSTHAHSAAAQIHVHLTGYSETTAAAYRGLQRAQARAVVGRMAEA